jgi:thiosulfate dehydrogenase [quinone] large subunit
MLTTPNGTATYQPTGRPTVAAHLRSIVRWPFTSRLASPIWLAVRLYLAYTWFTMGLDKLSSGFLTGDPIGDILKLTGSGVLPVPLEAFRPVAQLLVDLGVTPLLSYSMPFLEMAIALAFISGILIVPAALGAIFLNANFLLSGIAIVALDGRFIVLQLLLILAWQVAGYIGLEAGVVQAFKTLSRGVRTRLVARSHTLT